MSNDLRTMAQRKHDFPLGREEAMEISEKAPKENLTVYTAVVVGLVIYK